MKERSVVIYKNHGAVIKSIEGDKITVEYSPVPYSADKKMTVVEQKVREKDFVPLHSGPVTSLKALLAFNIENAEAKIAELYDLLSCDEESFAARHTVSELAELVFGSFDADSSWAFYSILADSPEFLLLQDEFRNGKVLFAARTAEEIAEIRQKAAEKELEAKARALFIARLRERKIDLPSDARFMTEVEALALGRAEKSKAMLEAGISQTPENAHRLLIDTGFWDITKNPYPSRCGFSFNSAQEQLGNMPQEERLTVPGTAYAIDSEHSKDPDDAIAFDGTYLWVHIADPASSVMPGSTIDIAARKRGTTLYIPECTSRMLCESSLEEYALGLREESHALSFRIKLDENSNVEECRVFKTTVDVKRLTYRSAEEMKESAELKQLFEIARKNKQRRIENGAIGLDRNEVGIAVDPETKKVSIFPRETFESCDMVAEMMILAGEGAARFAYENGIPFQYIGQDKPEFPEDIPEGIAGNFAKMKLIRKHFVVTSPACHNCLGLSFYSHVTSPLRRYSDLVAHQQLRAFINGRSPLSADEMTERIMTGETASLSAKKASRLSDLHWKLIYLIQNPEMRFEACCVDKRNWDSVFYIPAIDMQTVLKTVDFEPNEKAVLKTIKVDIPLQKADFMIVSQETL